VSTVLIAAASNLGAMKQRGEYRDAMAFVDTDALRALEAITRHRPDLIVLESAFAATSRGTALINRIKGDPSLGRCEVRITTHRLEPDAPPDASAPSAQEPQPMVSAATPPNAAAESPATFDSGTRRAPRVDIVETVELQIDGGAGKLIDLSTSGAQVVSPMSLKPNQRVRLTFPGSVQMRVNAAVAWVIFEMPQGAPRYRAGVAFADADPAEIQRFMTANKKG
jgi:hypothetical protein